MAAAVIAALSASVQTHSYDSSIDGRPMLPPKNFGEGRCLRRKWVPAFARKTKEGDAVLNHVNASEH
jgi:hypothetical protein